MKNISELKQDAQTLDLIAMIVQYLDYEHWGKTLLKAATSGTTLRDYFDWDDPSRNGHIQRACHANKLLRVGAASRSNENNQSRAAADVRVQALALSFAHKLDANSPLWTAKLRRHHLGLPKFGSEVTTGTTAQELIDRMKKAGFGVSVSADDGETSA